MLCTEEDENVHIILDRKFDRNRELESCKLGYRKSNPFRGPEGSRELRLLDLMTIGT
jgi:hypothetical protein